MERARDSGKKRGSAGRDYPLTVQGKLPGDLQPFLVSKIAGSDDQGMRWIFRYGVISYARRQASGLLPVPPATARRQHDLHVDGELLLERKCKRDPPKYENSFYS